MTSEKPTPELVPDNTVQAAVYGWNRFWFRPADPTPLGLVRICAGLVVLYIHVMYSFDLLAFMGPNGWASTQDMIHYRDTVPHYLRSQDWKEMPDYQPPTEKDPERAREEREFILTWEGFHPSSAYSRGYYAWSIFFNLTSPGWIWAAHLTCLVIFFLLTIGFCTRVVSVLAWLAAQSYIQRSPISLYGQDTILNFALFYLMIGPSGAALSVDRLIQRYTQSWRVLRARSSPRKGGTLLTEDNSLDLGRPAPSISANFALRLLQVHVCIVYFSSGVSKLQGTSWWGGTAIWGTMANPEFSPVHWGIYRDVLVYLSKNRYLWELVMNGAGVATLAFEVGFCFLVWNRWLRWPMIVSALALHIGIAFFMSLYTFSMIMVCVVLAFVPAEAIHQFIDRLGRGKGGFRLAFAPRERGQGRAASLVRAFDVWDQVKLDDGLPPAPASAAERLQLTTPEGQAVTGYAAFERLVRALRLLWPVALVTWIPGVRSVAEKRYPSLAERVKLQPASGGRQSPVVTSSTGG